MVAPRCHKPQVPTPFKADIDRQQRWIANVKLLFSKRGSKQKETGWFPFPSFVRFTKNADPVHIRLTLKCQYLKQQITKINITKAVVH